MTPTAPTPARTAMLALLILAASAMPASNAHAWQAPQTPPSATPPAAATPAPPDGALSTAEFNRMFEAYALLQAQNQLRLTDEQYADFIVRLRALQNARRRHQQGRMRLIQDLRRLTNPQNETIDEPAVRTVLEALSREDATGYEQIQKALASVDEILDVRQRARFRLLEENLEKWKLELLRRVRQPVRGQKPRLSPPTP